MYLILIYLLKNFELQIGPLTGSFLREEIMNYIKKKISKGWIVVNKKTGAHSHFRSEYGCYLIMKFLNAGIYPDNSYLQASYDRLENGKQKKERYINKR